MYCHTSSENVSISGVRRARFLTFGYFSHVHAQNRLCKHSLAQALLDGCKRTGLADTLAISIVFNTTKQMYPDFKKTFFWSSENQKNQEKLSKKLA
jgi:hypothetical protein